MVALLPFVAVASRAGNRELREQMRRAGIGLGADGGDGDAGEGAQHGGALNLERLQEIVRRRGEAGGEGGAGRGFMREHLMPFLIGVFTGFMFGLPAFLCVVGGRLPPAARLGVAVGALLSLVWQMAFYSTSKTKGGGGKSEGMGGDDPAPFMGKGGEKGGHRTAPSGADGSGETFQPNLPAGDFTQLGDNIFIEGGDGGGKSGAARQLRGGADNEGGSILGSGEGVGGPGLG